MLPRTKRSGVDGSGPRILKLSTFLASVLILSATISPPLAAEESVGEKIKKIFSTPTPTPTPHKRKKSTTAKKEAPSASPTLSPKKKSISVRRSGELGPEVSRKDDSFKFNNLQPWDLLFWTGIYPIQRDPPITQAMIYLGREKKTGTRVMVGASDGRPERSQQRFGV